MRRDFKRWPVAGSLILSTWMLGALGLAQTSPVEARREAEARGDVVAVGAHAGFFDVNHISNTVFGYGVSAHVPVRRNVLLGVGLDYWSERESTFIDETDVQLSDLAASIDGKYLFESWTAQLRPFVGAGVALHRLNATFRGPGFEPGRASRWAVMGDRRTANELGFDLAAGLLYAVQRRLDISGEIKYRNILNDDTDFDQLAVLGGLAYAL